jgi:outer membrane lipoprotein-sorting protein
MMRTVIVAVLFLPFGAALAQTPPPSVGEILKKVGEVYKNVKDYEFVYEGHSGDRTLHGTFAFKSPYKYRLEGRGLEPDLDPNEVLSIIADGSNIWIYYAQANIYVRRDFTPYTSGNMSPYSPEFTDIYMTQRYRHASDYIATARLLGDEKIGDRAAKLDCYVLVVFPNGPNLPFTWWIDKSTYRILREDDAGNIVTFTTVKLDEPLSDNLFKFDPPQGARKVESLP